MNVPSGYTALDMIGFTDQGVYNSATAYVKNDIVHYNGNLWKCLVDDTTAVTPTEGANWTVFLAEPTSAAEDIIAPVEATATSTRIYSVGDQLILGDVLYDVKQAINVGDTLTEGTNIAAADTIVEQLAEKADSADLAAVATSGEYSDLNNLPTLGTAAAKNVPESGDASNTEVVMGNDTRLTNARNAADVPAWAKAPNKPTYNGSEIATSTAESGTDQQSISDTIASGTSMDGAVGTLLNNDKTLDTNVASLKETLTNEVSTRSELTAHNLNGTMYWNYSPRTHLGVTFTYNHNDGTISVSGTNDNTDSSSFGTQNTYCFIAPVTAQVILSNVMEGITNSSVYCTAWDATDSNRPYTDSTKTNRVASNAKAYGTNEISFWMEKGHLYRIACWVAKGFATTLNGEKYKPLLRLATDEDTTYTPYAATNQQLTGLISNDFTNGAVNLLPNHGTTQVKNGVTFTVNDDGSVTANGTATADTYFYTLGTSSSNLENFYIDKPVTLSGCPSGSNGNNYFLILNEENTTPHADIGQGKTFTMASTTTKCYVRMKIQNGVTVNNLVFKPMLTLADMPNSDYNHYVPYAKSNKELTDIVSDYERTDIAQTAYPAILYSDMIFIKNGNVVQAGIRGVKTLTVGTSYSLGTLPVEYRPKINVIQFLTTSDLLGSVRFQVLATGEVSLYCYKATSETQFNNLNGNITWIV